MIHTFSNTVNIIITLYFSVNIYKVNYLQVIVICSKIHQTKSIIFDKEDSSIWDETNIMPFILTEVEIGVISTKLLAQW